MVLLGFGVWAIAYGPIVSPSFRTTEHRPSETETLDAD